MGARPKVGLRNLAVSNVINRLCFCGMVGRMDKMLIKDMD